MLLPEVSANEDIQGIQSESGFLLPPSLDEFVPENHEARIVNDVVDTINLSPLLAKYEGGGAPAYHPAMMLKVIIYAYSRDIYSSRSIAQELMSVRMLQIMPSSSP